MMLKTEPTYIENKDKGTKTEIPPNPYLWLSQNKEDVYYQDGEFYTGRGEDPIKYDDVPNWFWNDLKKCYPLDFIEKWGIVLPENRVRTQEERQIEVERKWKCEEEGCGKEFPFASRHVHMAAHTRKKKKAEKELTVVE